MEAQKKGNPYILFRTQLVLLISFILFILLMGIAKTCGPETQPIKPESRQEIRR
jgi:hypothetical protein